jgi:hypothetical protein
MLTLRTSTKLYDLATIASTYLGQRSVELNLLRDLGNTENLNGDQLIF